MELQDSPDIHSDNPSQNTHVSRMPVHTNYTKHVMSNYRHHHGMAPPKGVSHDVQEQFAQTDLPSSTQTDQGLGGPSEEPG